MTSVKYEPDERCSPLVSVGVGLQLLILVLTPAITVITVVAVTAGPDSSYLDWAVFATLVTAAVTTILQTLGVGRVGGTLQATAAPDTMFIAVSIAALAAGGPAMMAGLVMLSGVLQITVATWLAALRKIITPVVSGTAMMLIAVSVAPVIFSKMAQVPDGAHGAAAPVIAGITVAVSVGLALRSSGAWRLWSPILGVIAGCASAAAFGVYDIQRVLDAPWVSVPFAGWPGLDLSPPPDFWRLVPMFLVVTLMLSIKVIGASIAIQAVSRRRPRVADFRLVQGALNANGIGTLLAGFAGVLPLTVTTGSNISIIRLTGVAYRGPAIAAGLMFLGVAFLPKVTAFIVALPGPVAGIYLAFIIGALFVSGAGTVAQSGLDFRDALIAGLAFLVGVGAESGTLFPQHLDGPWSALLGNGVTAGAFTAVALTLFLELTAPRRRRLDAEVAPSALPSIDAFLKDLARRNGWSEAASQRLRAAGEETLNSLIRPRQPQDPTPRLVIKARQVEGQMEMEYTAVLGQENVEDHLAWLGDHAQAPDADGSDLSFRLLRYYASSVRHRQYHGLDIVTVQVDKQHADD